MTSEPSREDLEWFRQVEQGYVGLEKPKVAHVSEPKDPHSYKRRRAAERLGVTEDLLNDEPDYLSIDAQGME